MYHQRLYSRSEQWLQRIFDSRMAREGGVVRRKASDIEREVGWRRFVRELDRRGYRAVENSGQVIIFCNNAPVRPIAPRAATNFLQ